MCTLHLTDGYMSLLKTVNTWKHPHIRKHPIFRLCMIYFIDVFYWILFIVFMTKYSIVSNLISVIQMSLTAHPAVKGSGSLWIFVSWWFLHVSVFLCAIFFGGRFLFLLNSSCVWSCCTETLYVILAWLIIATNKLDLTWPSSLQKKLASGRVWHIQPC